MNFVKDISDVATKIKRPHGQLRWLYSSSLCFFPSSPIVTLKRAYISSSVSYCHGWDSTTCCTHGISSKMGLYFIPASYWHRPYPIPSSTHWRVYPLPSSTDNQHASRHYKLNLVMNPHRVLYRDYTGSAERVGRNTTSASTPLTSPW